MSQGGKVGDTSLSRASHLHTLQLRSSIWDYEGYGKVASLSFRGKNKAQGKKELTIGRQISVIRRTLLGDQLVLLPPSTRETVIFPLTPQLVSGRTRIGTPVS